MTNHHRFGSRILLLALLAVLFTTMVPPGTAAPPPVLPAGQHTVYVPMLRTAPDAFREIASARTATSDVAISIVNGTSTARLRFYEMPQYYLDPLSGRWDSIDTRLVPGADGSYVNVAGSFRAAFGTGRAQRGQFSPPLLSLSRGGHHQVSLDWPGGSLPVPHVNESTITYAGVAPYTDLEYSIHSWGVKEEAILHHPAAAPTLHFTLAAPGLLLQQVNGTWVLADDRGVTRWRLLPLSGADANNVAAPLSLHVSTLSPGQYDLEVRVDPRWLSAPERAFPVRLDPSIADPIPLSGDTYIQSGNPDIFSWNQINRFVGYATIGGKAITRLFVPFNPTMPDWVQTEDIVSAEVVYWQYLSGNSGDTLSTSVYAVPQAWDMGSLSWNSRPPEGTLVAGNVAMTTENGFKRWNVTDWYKTMRATPAQNHGLMIRADNETPVYPGGMAVFHSPNCISCTAEQKPYYEILVKLDSGLDPLLDTWSFENMEGRPSFEQFVAEYGVPATTHLITETRLIQVVQQNPMLTLPISFTGIPDAVLPLTITDTITDTSVISRTHGQPVPRPISYMYEEVIVKSVYDDQFTEYYEGALKGGLCAGMAATVADFKAISGDLSLTDYGAPSVSALPNDDRSRELIQKYHGRQVSAKVLDWLAENGRYTTNEYYDHLAARIGTADWWANPEIIGIVSGSSCSELEVGHALFPYKVVPLPGNLARIYVYDPNHPMTTPASIDQNYIELNLTAGTWSYQLAVAPNIEWNGSVLYSTPLSLFQEKPTLPTQEGEGVMMVDGGYRGSWGGYRGSWGGYRGSWGGDDDGTHTGCYEDDGSPTFVREISRTMRVTPLNGPQADTDFPDTLYFPAGQDWTFTGAGTDGDAIGDMLLFGDHSAAGFLSATNDGTRDSARIDAAFQTLELRTNDASKAISAYQLHETANWTRIYAVSNTTLGTGESLVLRVTDLDQLEVINTSAVDKTFDLGLGHVGSDGVGTVIWPDVHIGAGERRIYTPIDWTNLTTSPVKVEIDEHADGTIDRVEVIGAQVFPVTAPAASVPSQPGTEFVLLSKAQHGPGQFGWMDPATITPAGTPPPPSASGEQELRAWLQQGGSPALPAAGQIVAVPGTHGGLFKSLQPDSGPAWQFHQGDIVVIPLFDTLVPGRGGHPSTYRIAGFAVVEITDSDSQGSEDEPCVNDRACIKRIGARVLLKIEY